MMPLADCNSTMTANRDGRKVVVLGGLLGKVQPVIVRGKKIRESAEASRARQRLLRDYRLTTKRLIIRQLPDRWFKSSPPEPIFLLSFLYSRIAFDFTGAGISLNV
jgi:hypothetical protein